MNTIMNEIMEMLMGISGTTLCWTSRLGNYQPDVRKLKEMMEEQNGAKERKERR